MKKLLLILLCLPFIGFGQQTYVPDDNFETYLEVNGMGDGIQLNDSVNFWAIEMLINLDVSNQNISDLTGIEDFTALTFLDCKDNQISSLDLSNNLYLEFLACYKNQLTSLDVNGLTALWSLDCGENNLTSLDVSNNISLEQLSIYNNQFTSLDVSNNILLGLLACSDNQLTSIDISNNINLSELSLYGNNLISLDVSHNTALDNLFCGGNNITELDLSKCPVLERLECAFNQLICLNLKAGNNVASIDQINATNNPQLSCVEVDSIGFFSSNPFNSFNFDAGVSFSNSCNNNCSGTTDIEEYTSTKELLKVTGLLGRETKQTNQPLLYLYDDGTVEKRIVIN